MAVSTASQHGVGRIGPSPDQLYVASLQGRQVAPLEEQAPALAAAASLHIPVPPETGHPVFDRRDVAYGLASNRPSLLDLHAGALLLEGYGGPARRAGKITGGSIKVLGLAVGIPAKIVGDSVQNRHPLAGSIFKGIENGAGAAALLGQGLGRVGLEDVRRATDRLLVRRYGEQMSLDDRQRAVALRAVLLGRLARIRPAEVMPDEAWVQLAAQYMNGYRRSSMNQRIDKMALELGRAYHYLNNRGVEDTARKLTRMRARGTPFDDGTEAVTWSLAGQIREVARAAL